MHCLLAQAVQIILLTHGANKLNPSQKIRFCP